MNTLGKILVILNLLFTLVVFAFLVLWYATQTNWARHAERLQADVTAAKALHKGATAALAAEDATFKKTKHDLDILTATMKAKDEDWATEKKVLENKVDEKETEIKEHKKYREVAEKELERRNKEVAELGTTLTKRDKAILELDDTIRELTAKVLAEQNKANSLAARNLALQDEIKRRDIALIKERAGGTGGIKLATGPNPPITLVKGTVDKVDVRNPALIELSVGSDHGLEKGHTLEAYRMDPEPTYLGMVRIEEVHHHSAIGRLEPSSVTRRLPLRAGDKVISDLKAR